VTARRRRSFGGPWNLNPGAYSAWFNLGMILTERDVPEAVRAFEKFIESAPSNDDWKAWRTFAEDYVAQHRPGGATPRRAPSPTRPDGRAADEASQGNLTGFTVTIGGERWFVQTENDSGVPFDELVATVERFVRVPSWLDAYLVLDEHPELMSTAAETVLQYLGRAQDSDGSRLIFDMNLRLLRGCRETGAATAFAEIIKVDVDRFQLLARGAKTLQPKLQAFVTAPTLSDKRTVLERSPELSSDPAATAFLGYLITMQRSAEARAVLEQNLWLLWRARRDGVSRVFGTIGYQAGPDEATIAQANLATSLLQRFESSGDAAELERALRAAETARRDVPSGSSAAGVILSTLGSILLRRAEVVGGPSDLDTSIDAHTQAIAVAQPGTPVWAGRMANRANALARRFDAHGTIGDLDAATEDYRSAQKAVPVRGAEWAEYRAGEARMLRRRFGVSHEAGDLDQAIAAYHEAIAVLPPQTLDWARLQTNLGNVLRERFELASHAADIDGAVAAAEVALTVPSGGSSSCRIARSSST
jgi:tetratricopeptide (TPR) repeat protein